MLAWLIIATLATTTLVWAWLVFCTGWRRNAKYHLETTDAPTDNHLPAPAPSVVVICPGRNEEKHLPQTLPALCRQNYPNHRVIFIDDQSTDDTPKITARLAQEHKNLTVLRNDTDPPPGWVGKCWAIHLAYQSLQQQEGNDPSDPNHATTTPDYVCFTDADIHWHSDCLRTAIAHAHANPSLEPAGLVALFPKLIFGSTLERLAESTMVLALWLLYPFEKAMDPKNPNTLSGGAFMLVKRNFYDAAGTHQAVASHIVEDLALGRAVKAAGARVTINTTQSLMHCRMYDSPADLWEGLTKNAYAGLNNSPLAAAVLISWTIIGNVLAPAYLPAAATWWVLGGGPLAIAAAALAAATLLLQACPMNAVRTRLDLPARYVWAVPIGSAIYLTFMIASIWRYYCGGNVWKGRSYPQRGGHDQLTPATPHTPTPKLNHTD